MDCRGAEHSRGEIMGVEDDRIVWARLYLEPVEENGQHFDEVMRTITGGGEQPEGDQRSEEASPT